MGFLEQEIRTFILKEIETQEIYAEDKIKELILETVFGISVRENINYQERNALIESLTYSLCGYDALEYYLKDPKISEIMVNNYETIFYEKEGKIYQGEHVFESNLMLEHVIQKIVGRINRLVNETTPIVDARLKDGSRVNVVLAPVSLNGPVITIRKFIDSFLRLEDLLEEGSLTKESMDFLKILVRCKYNIFISGGTSSGKTTFLNLLSNSIPKEERVILIEDSAELRIKGLSNLVSLEVKAPNIEGVGAITIEDLIKTALRMRPDRIIVGEVRGREAFDMLTAMNTGHDGSLSTGHGNSGEDMLLRLTTMVLMGQNFKEEIARSLIKSSLDIVVHLGKKGPKKQLVAILEVDKKSQGLELKPLFLRDEKGYLREVNTLENTGKLLWYG